MMDHDNYNSGSDRDSQCNLIVNYLPQEMDDGDLKELFGAIGPVKNCKIIRHKQTGWSYGFGFVEYDKAEHAEQATKTLNRLQLKEKTLKVAYARPPGEATKNTNLYVQGLPSTMTQLMLEDLFKPYGEIIQAKILTNPNGECKGTGFVLFENKEAAQRSIDEMNGNDVLGVGKSLVVRFAQDNASKVRAPPAVRGRGGRGGGYGGQQGGQSYGGPMRTRGGSFGNRYNPMQGNSNQSGGYGQNSGFYGSSAAGGYEQGNISRGGFGGNQGFGARGGGFGARGGQSNFNSYGVNGGGSGDDYYNAGNFGFSQGAGSGFGSSARGGRGGFRNGAASNYYSEDFTTDTGMTAGAGEGSGHVLFCYNIGPDTKEHQIWQLFTQYGQVLKVDVMVDHKQNKGKNFGFVTMKNYNQALEAMNTLNGQAALCQYPLQIRFKNDKE